MPLASTDRAEHSAPAISTERLTRDFGSLRAVDDLSIVVPRGTVFGFLGPNGSGKTTTIRLLLGLVKPTAGRSTVMGHDSHAEGDRVREACGALLEHHGLYERLSAEENLELVGRIWHMPSDARRARTKELLDRMGLWERRSEPVGRWSRGMKQKAALARALFHRPMMAFLDEPTGGLDPVASSDIREELTALASEGVTVFLTTHNLDEAERMCDLVAVVHRGRLLAMGRPQDLRASTSGEQVIVSAHGLEAPLLDDLRRTPFVRSLDQQDGELRVGLQPDIEPAVLVSHIVRAGVAVNEVRRGAAGLHEAFRMLVADQDGGEEDRP